MPTRTKVLPIAREQEEDLFTRVNTKITRKALLRLNYACELREQAEPRDCTQGTILEELIMEYLPPAPGEDVEAPTKAEKLPKRKRVKKAKRGSGEGPKAMSA